MLPCKGCAYRQSIPGDAHDRCTFDWMNRDKAGLVVMFREVTPRVAQWFRFPFNYEGGLIAQSRDEGGECVSV